MPADTTDEQLLEIDSEAFEFTLEGPLPSPSSYANRGLPAVALTSSPWPLTYRFDAPDLTAAVLNVHGRQRCTVTLHRDVLPLAVPLVYETIEYHFRLRSKTADVHLSQDGRRLSKTPRGRLATGSINFRNAAGMAQLEFRSPSGMPLAILEIFVGSVKMAYFSDRRQLIAYLEPAYRALAIRAMSPTTAAGTLTREKSTDVEFADALTRHVSKIDRSVARIEVASLHSRVSVSAMTRVDRLTHVTGRARSVLRRIPLAALATGRVRSERRTSTHDSPENRFVKATLGGVARSVRAWQRKFPQRAKPSGAESQLHGAITAASGSLRAIAANAFWSSVSDSAPAERGRAQFHADYLSLHRDLLRLRRAVRIDDRGRAAVGQAPMNDLYEMWAFVRLAGLLALAEGAPVLDPFTVEVSALRARISPNKKEIGIGRSLLGCQPLYTTDAGRALFSPLTPQQPDAVLYLKHRDAYVFFDAKYRVDIRERGTGKALSNSAVVATPFDASRMSIRATEDALNTTHRYRDAIRSSTGGARIDSSVYVLFPHREESEREAGTNACKAFAYGVGAIPMLPGSNSDDLVHAGLCVPAPYEAVGTMRALLRMLV